SFPAREFLAEQRFDLGDTLSIILHALGALAIVVRAAHAARDRALLVFEGGDLRRQLLELAPFLEAELCTRLGSGPRHRDRRALLRGVLGRRLRTLTQPVRVTADILAPDAVAF